MKIILADDDPTMLRIASLSLTRLGGHSVACARDGEEAVAQALAAPPDLVILDGQMPRLDGPGALRRLRAEPATREVPVILLTASSDEATLALYRSLRPAGIIPKPFRPEALPVLVREALAAPDGS